MRSVRLQAEGFDRDALTVPFSGYRTTKQSVIATYSQLCSYMNCSKKTRPHWQIFHVFVRARTLFDEKRCRGVQTKVDTYTYPRKKKRNKKNKKSFLFFGFFLFYAAFIMLL